MPASDFSLDSDLATVGVFGVSPFLRHQIDDWMTLEVRYGLTRVEVAGDDGLEDTTSHPGRVAAVGEPVFDRRLGWGLTAEIKDTQGDGGGRSARRWLAVADTRFALTPEIALLAGAGYGVLEDDTLNDRRREGVAWSAGVDLRPGPRSSLRVTYGRI